MNFVKALALPCALLASCAIAPRAVPDAPEPDCNPRGPDVVVIMAPDSVEIPECTETAVDEPSLNVARRQWCCWKDKAPSLEDVEARMLAKTLASLGGASNVAASVQAKEQPPTRGPGDAGGGS